MICPLISSEYGAHNCEASNCRFTDEAGHCLVQQALQLYVAKERTKIAEEEEKLRKETELMKAYWALKKDGIRSPIKLLSKDEEEEIYTPPATVIIDDTPQIDGYDTPVVGGITYAHITPTEKYPHGGWFEVPGFHGEPE